MIKRTLMGLNDMKIKFPGKTDEEAEFILDKVFVPSEFKESLLYFIWVGIWYTDSKLDIGILINNSTKL